MNEHTDGMIESVLDDIPPEAVMYLVNALAFDATWVSPYDEGAVEEGTFTAARRHAAEGADDVPRPKTSTWKTARPPDS